MAVPTRIASTPSPNATAPGARGGGEVDPAARPTPFGAMRTEPGVVVALICAAGVAWWWTADRMDGMDTGPGTALGSLAWFTGVWATMMAAMMLPSLGPAAATFVTSVRHEAGRLFTFGGGYLLVWSVAGVGAYGVFELGTRLLGGSLAWDGAGRWVAAGVLALAALYQLTPPKQAFLARCRSPLAHLAPTSRGSGHRALASGLRSGMWCLGSSWALMAALFALGVMSLVWMGVIAVLVALEKVGPWGRGASVASAVALAVLAVAILAVPHDLPGFVVPGSTAERPMMTPMR
jgi:predicted metal-binding membrane protein